MENFRFQRIFVIVMDSVGIGEAPDAANFNDVGADTLGHIAEHRNGLHMPTLASFGLGHIRPIKGIEKVKKPRAYFGKMAEASSGKDTMTGHWELMGLKVEKPFQTFPNGFPSELIKILEEKTRRPVLGNKVASGTEIIKELGEKQIETGGIIVYTSADSVLQIAAHEDVVPLEELYEICEKARKLTLEPEYMVGRVIARPFIGKNGKWERTANRHDYALKPFGRTVLTELKEAELAAIGIGKIRDIFDGEGITASVRTTSDDDGMDKVIEALTSSFTGLCFLNLVDFDAKYGHRRDPDGYGEALEAFDQRLGEAITFLKEGDLLIVTADHGNDPTFHGTDHTREYVPLLVHYKGLEVGNTLGIRNTFADVGATIADNFKLPLPKNGTSFLAEIIDDQGLKIC